MASSPDPTAPVLPALATRRDLLLGAGAGLATLAAPALPVPAAEPTEWLTVRDFGAKGDGVTDDGPALIRMRDHMRQDRSRHYTVLLPPGHYAYTNNRWLAHVGAVTIEGGGAKLQCTAPTGWNQNMRPINTQSLFQELGDAPIQQLGPYHNGHLIATAAKGATRIALTNTAESALFSVGLRVLLYGFDHQWASSQFPNPNARYFQYNVVIAVDSSTGEIALADPLQYDFRADWRESVHDAAKNNVFGRARMARLERPLFYYARHLEFGGIEFMDNPNDTASNGLAVSAETLILRDCKVACQLWPSENKVALYKNCTAPGVEGDKVCERVVFDACHISSFFTACTGVKELVVQDCELQDCHFNVSPRAATISRNQIKMKSGEASGALRSYYNVWPVDRVVFEDNVVEHDDALLYIINNAPLKALVVSAVGPNNSMLLDDTDSARNDVIRNLLPGYLVFRDDLSDYGTVSAVEWTGSQWKLIGTWGEAVGPGQTWQFANIRSIRERGTVVNGGARRLFYSYRSPMLAEGADADGNVRLHLADAFSFAAGNESHELLGEVRSLRVVVMAPYTGPDSYAMLYVNLIVGTSLTNVLTMNLGQVGFAETDLSGVRADPPLTTPYVVRPLSAGTMTKRLQLLYRNGGQPFTGTVEQMPRLGIEISVRPLGT